MSRPAQPTVLQQVLVCPTCKKKFPVPEPSPETSFKTHFSCHVLFEHLRSEVEAEMGGDMEDMEVCPADECPYNIVQLREDGVPDAEGFLVKHYISKHLEVLLTLVTGHHLYAPRLCLKTIAVSRPEGEGKAIGAKSQGMPNAKLKPIFLDKYSKFSRTVAKCEEPAECDPMHIVIFLTQWTSRRNYSMEGVKLLVTWVSESHNPVDEKPLEEHPRIIEFLGLIKNKLSRGEAASAIPESVVTECKAYGSVVNTPKDIVTATVCSVCQEKFDHTIKLLYHMLHMHKMNPVHFICKNLRAKPVRCGECQVPCMSPVVYALHTDQHTLKKHLECPECHKKYYTTTKYYSDDMCGDNAFPKAVKEHVNGAVKRLQVSCWFPSS